MRRPTASTSASRCRPSRTRISFRSRTSERSSRSGMRPAKCSPKLHKTNLREGTGGANDTTRLPPARGFGGRGGAQTDTGKRNLQWNPVGCGPRVSPVRGRRRPVRAVARGGAARWRARARGWWRRSAGRERARIASIAWSPPFAASDARDAFEANSAHDVGRVQRRRQDAVRERGQLISTPCASPIRASITRSRRARRSPPVDAAAEVAAVAAAVDAAAT